MFRKVLGIAAILSLGACVSPYVATPYDRASANVQGIAMADDAVPPKLTAFEVASIGSNFGLVGALVNAGIQAGREDAMTKALDTVDFDPEARLEARVISAMAAQGYQVAVVEGPLRAKRDFLVSYPAAPADADAYLDVVVINYGYLSAGAFQPWRPTAQASVRLVSASDPSNVLMENTIAYNTMYPAEGVITLTPNPEYSFANQGEMEANPAKLAAGIEDALNQIADTAAQLLR